VQPALIGGAAGIGSLNAEPAANRGQVILYKNPECGCCEGYADHLRQNGFEVSAKATNDLLLIGQKYGIPDDLAPCHISLIGGYVVGRAHPGRGDQSAAVRKAADNRKSISPGWPEGTPGMPGTKPGPLDDLRDRQRVRPKVYAIV